MSNILNINIDPFEHKQPTLHKRSILQPKRNILNADIFLLRIVEETKIFLYASCKDS